MLVICDIKEKQFGEQWNTRKLHEHWKNYVKIQKFDQWRKCQRSAQTFDGKHVKQNLPFGWQNPEDFKTETFKT